MTLNGRYAPCCRKDASMSNDIIAILLIEAFSLSRVCDSNPLSAICWCCFIWSLFPIISHREHVSLLGEPKPRLKSQLMTLERGWMLYIYQCTYHTLNLWKVPVPDTFYSGCTRGCNANCQWEMNEYVHAQTPPIFTHSVRSVSMRSPARWCSCRQSGFMLANNMVDFTFCNSV